MATVQEQFDDLKVQYDSVRALLTEIKNPQVDVNQLERDFASHQRWATTQINNLQDRVAVLEKEVQELNEWAENPRRRFR